MIKLPSTPDQIPGGQGPQGRTARAPVTDNNAAGINAAGQNLQQMGGEFFKLAQEAAEDRDLAVAREAKKLFNQDVSKILKDPDTGYLLQRGKAASEAMENAGKAIDDSLRRISSSFKNDDQRRMFDDATAPDVLRAQTTVGLHGAQQTKAWSIGETKALADQAADDLADGDEDAREALVDNLTVFAEDTGLGAKERDKLIADAESGARTRMAETLMAEADYEGAATYIEGNKETIGRSNAAKLNGRLKQLQNASKATQQAAKNRDTGLRKAITFIDKNRKLRPAMRQVAALDAAEAEWRTGKLTTDEYKATRDAIKTEIGDETARQEAVTTDIALGVQDLFEKGATEAQILEAQPGLVTQLRSTASGDEAWQKMTTARGKAQRDQDYYNGYLLRDNADEFRRMFPNEKKLVQATLGMTGPQRADMQGWFDLAWGRGTQDADRIKTHDLVDASIAKFPWAKIENAAGTMVIDKRVRDVFVREFNEEAQRQGKQSLSADERAKVLSGMLNDVTWTHTASGMPIPRAVFSVTGREDMESTRTTRFGGTISSTTIPEVVRSTLTRWLQYDTNQRMRRQDLRAVEDMWDRLGRPASAETLKKKWDAFGQAEAVAVPTYTPEQAFNHADDSVKSALAQARADDGSFALTDNEVKSHVDKIIEMELEVGDITGSTTQHRRTSLIYQFNLARKARKSQLKIDPNYPSFWEASLGQ